MIGIIGLAGGAATLMMGGATLAAGLATGAAGLGVNAATGTVRLAKDSIQALSPIGAGGSQARRRLMERGLIESGVNRTKQLKKMTGKAAGLLGVNVSLASILKQSQIFTGVFGTVFQILGAFVDIMLIPLMPVIKWVLNNLIDFIPDVQAASSKMTKFGERVQRYLQELFEDGRGLWGKDGILYKLAADAGTALKKWWEDTAWPNISDFWETTIWPTIKKWAEALWAMTPWGKEKDENERMAAALMNRGVHDTPGPNIFPKFGVPLPSLGFGAGQTDEFAEHDVPEGYPGGPPSAGSGSQSIIDNMQEVERDAERMMSNFGEAVQMVPELMRESVNDVFGLGSGGTKAAAAKGLMEAGISSGGRAGRGLIEIIGQGNMGLFPGNPIFDDQVGGSGTPYRGGFGELVTIGAVANERSKAAAQAAIYMSNQQKENYAATYKDEASQYEDELYFQEMMLGVGRY